MYMGLFKFVVILELFSAVILNNLQAKQPEVLKNGVVFECSESGHIWVKGNTVKLSDFVDSDGVIRLKCKNNVTSNTINVFAIKTVTIDRDLKEIGTLMQINFVGPTWEIVGKRKINIEGERGKELPRARDGKDLKTPDGEDGEEGGPGGPGGNFFGIGEKFINSKFLTISVNGGNGGKGQDGGHGLNGVLQGVFLGPLEYCSCTEPFPCVNGTIEALSDQKQRDKFNCELVEHTQIYLRPSFVLNASYILETFVHKVKREKATHGGRGGNGGREGKRGVPGHIIVFAVVNQNKYLGTNLNNFGALGGKGKGGHGGEHAGIGSCTVFEEHCYIKLLLRKRTVLKDPECYKQNITAYMSNSGQSGVDGASSKGSKQPQPSKPFGESDVINVTKKYEMFVLEQDIVDEETKNQVFDFLSKLGGNGTTNFAQLVADFLRFENAIEHPETKDIDYVPFLQTLLNSIVNTVNKSHHLNIQLKKVFNYLYTAVSGRLYLAKNQTTYDVVMDFNELVEKSKQSLQDAQDNFDLIFKLNASNIFLIEYVEILKNKSTEIENLIDLLDFGATNSLNKSKDKILNFINSSKSGFRSVDEKDKIKLENELIRNGIFGCVYFLVKTCRLVMATGKTIFVVIQNTTSVMEQLILNVLQPLPKIPQLDKDIEQVENGFKSMVQEDVSNFIWVLDEMSKQIIEQFPDSHDIIDVISKIRERANGAKYLTDVQKLQYETIQEIEKKFNDTVSSKLNCLIYLPPLIVDILKSLSKVNKLIIFEATYKVKIKMRRLYLFKTFLGTTVSMFSKRFTEVLKGVQIQIKKTAQLVFNISDLYVQDNFKKAKLQLKNILVDLKIERSQSNGLIEQVEIVIELIIRLFDRFPRYQQLKVLHDHYNDISSKVGKSIKLTVKEYKNASTFLENVIKKNIILQPYKIVLDSFKTLAFPLVEFCRLDNPLDISYKNGFNLFKEWLIMDLKSMRESWKNFPAFCDPAAKYLSYSGFKYGPPYSNPFYMWSREDYNESISELLSGKEITLPAFVTKFDLKGQAIKFNLLEFEFISKNNDTKKEIDEILKGFKISATHLGYSYYKYFNELYLTGSKSFVLENCFEKNWESQPNCTSEDYDYILKGSPMFLSPYTLWKIKLINLTSVPFKSLDKFKNKVDLYLTGKGVIIFNSIARKLKDLQVSKYYIPIEEIVQP